MRVRDWTKHKDILRELDKINKVKIIQKGVLTFMALLSLSKW